MTKLKHINVKICPSENLGSKIKNNYKATAVCESFPDVLSWMDESKTAGTSTKVNTMFGSRKLRGE